MRRPREDADVDDLLNDLRYLWESQGPQGRRRGQKAIEELMWRWEFLPYDYWEWGGAEQAQHHEQIPDEVALTSIIAEASRRGYDLDFTLDKQFG
jgi:hypothetical protein